MDRLALFSFEDAEDAPLKIYGGVAQLGEHLLCKQGVRSSILLISTYFSFLRKRKVSKRKTTTHIVGVEQKSATIQQKRNGRIAQVVRAHA